MPIARAITVTEAGRHHPILASRAAMMAQPRPGAPSGVAAYVDVDDIRAATDKARSLDATVAHDVTEVSNAGSFSITIDPTGATVGLWQPMRK